MKISISKHFTIDEVQHSQYARDNELDNVLPSIYYMNAIRLANNNLEPIRARYGAYSPLSWYRSQKVNEGVGGSKKSDHMIACAADIRHSKVSNIELAEWIRDNLEFKQLILEPMNNLVHVSYVLGHIDKQVLTKVPGGYVPGLITSA